MEHSTDRPAGRGSSSIEDRPPEVVALLPALPAMIHSVSSPPRSFPGILFLGAASVAMAVFTSGCSKRPAPASSPALPEKIDFVTHVKPLLKTHCLPCHNTGLLLGNLNLENRELAFSSPFIIPGQPSASKFYTVTLLTEGKHAEAMPPEGPRLSDENKEVLRRWIEQGAPWPEGPEGTLLPVDPTKGAAG
ncbi:MAG TPA: c-type cytochrome domain-containing protein [Verrucomicrobiales bacterium]|nr:c-type cytochrome domain-containing protein [Verrucomicrobiales bacterium]